VRVAAHLGPDPAVVRAVAERLAEAGATGSGPTVLAAIDSSRETAHAEITSAAHTLTQLLDQPVNVLPLRTPLTVPDRAEVAVYLLAEGGFLDLVRAAGASVVAGPIGVHAAVTALIWSRYDAALR
jgi:sirohydrochlorin ferrochelatase